MGEDTASRTDLYRVGCSR